MGSVQFTAVSRDQNGVKKKTGQRHTAVKNKDEIYHLAVPVSKEMLPIDDTPLGSGKWRDEFCSHLEANYSQSMHWGDFGWQIRDLLDYDTLGQLNRATFAWAHDLLQLKSQIVMDTELALEGTKGDLVLSIMNASNGKTLLTGAPSLSYLDVEAFELNGISVETQNWRCTFPESATLSVLDALFTYGAEITRNLLMPNER
jgi:hypothetical protein